ncbi:DUF1398 family protein [Ferruginibacter sp. SUN002]|uniref:DUF1398 family protein n=1 Tax=Ferruginibacter sp. SUN002 TaxID=2937789 RepID=UPI003D35E6F7
MLDKIREQSAKAKNYPDLVSKLIEIGVESYTVEVSTGIILYRFANGMNAIHQQDKVARKTEDLFSTELTVKAIRDNQQGKTTFPVFMDGIAKAGVQFYEATLVGVKRVTYIGVGGSYEENIPI